jgi:hypothetical protein
MYNAVGFTGERNALLDRFNTGEFAGRRRARERANKAFDKMGRADRRGFS